MLAILLSVRTYTFEYFWSVHANFSVKLNIFSKYHQVRVNMNISWYTKSFLQTMILGQFNKMIICFGCALRFILLIGYASFTHNYLYLVNVWNNKFLKTNFFHLCSFLFCFVLFFLFLDFSLDFYSLDSLFSFRALLLYHSSIFSDC